MQQHCAHPTANQLDAKLANLQNILRDYGRIAVAFSAGVDSTLLLAVAYDVLGDDVFAVTGKSPSTPARETREAQEFCRRRGIRHAVVETHEFDLPGFDRNPPDRCYHCKKEILSTLAAAARDEGFGVIAEGSNADDDSDYRPGFRAVREMGVVSPLRDAELAKADVRELARQLGLEVWNKPAFACLNTRFPYGEHITPAKLALVDAAESFLRDQGFDQVRVRIQGDTARIEVLPDVVARLVEEPVRSSVAAKLHELGFAYVSIDLDGYRTGSMNEVIDTGPSR